MFLNYQQKWKSQCNNCRVSVQFLMSLFLICFLAANPMSGQINYSQAFTGCTSNPCNGWSWNIAGSMTATTGLGYTPCAVADPAARANLSATVTTGNLSATSSLGTSSGEITTFGFVYKCTDFTTGTATAANSCTFNIEWATAVGGPWNLIQSFQNVSSVACVPFTSNYFFPTAGQPIFMRVRAARNSGDFWVVVDDITLSQPTPALIESTTCSCNNDQTINMQDGTYTTALKIRYTDNAPMPAGLIYKLNASTGLTNTAGGVLGTPNFLYCNGIGCPAGIVAGQYFLPVRVQNSGMYTAEVDGPDADNVSEINLNTTCATLYPALPVIPFMDKNCLDLGINNFTSDNAVYSINNSLTNPTLPAGFSQTGTNILMVNNATINEADNNPTYELYLIKETAGCRVSSYKEFKVFKAKVAALDDTFVECRDTISRDTLFLSRMISTMNNGAGKFYINGNEVVDGKLGISGPICVDVTYSITDSCGMVKTDTKKLQLSIKPKAAFNFVTGPGEPISPVCSATPVNVGIVRTSTGPNPVFTITSNKPAYGTPTINGTNDMLTLPAPPLGDDIQYKVCLIESNNNPPVCGTIPAPTSVCADTLCKIFVVYRDRSDCGANALFTSTCEEYEPAYCQTYTVSAIRLHCDFFDFSTPNVLTADITLDQGVLDCDAEFLTGSYNVSFFGINFGPTAGCTRVEDLPFINIVCSVLGFEIFGWKPLGALYDALRCDKCLIEFISAIIGKLAGGDGGGVIVMADTDGDGGFDYLIENRFGFPVNGTFSVPNRVKGGGTLAVRAVGAWVNSPADVCGNFDINSVNILDKIPIGSIPVVGAIIEDILQVAGCEIDVALGVVTDATAKVLNNAEPSFLNCNTGGYVFAQTLDCTIPVDWSVPTAIDGCSGVNILYGGFTIGVDTTNYAGTPVLPAKLLSITEAGIYQTAGPVPGSILEPGIYPVTYTAVSCNGLPRLCTFNIVVTAGFPILECPGNITISNAVDLCGANVNGLAPYQGIGCASIINYSYTTPITNTVVSTNSTIKGTHNVPDGQLFEVGTTTITYTMLVDIDGDGDYDGTNPDETQMCSFDVVVEDNQDPHAVCLDVEVQLNNLGMATVDAIEAGANLVYVDGGSTDNCGGNLTIELSRDNISYFPSLDFDCANIGSNVVYLRVTDAAGNSRFCKAVIKVIDFFEGFKLDLDVPEVCFEPFQNTYDFSPYIVIARPNGANILHQNVSVLGPEIVGAFGISAFLPDPGSTNDPGMITTDGVYTLGTGTGWITISYILSINEQVNQIDDVSPLTGCFRMVHDIFRIEKLDPVWQGGFMCCDQLPVWLGGALWDGTGPPPIPDGMLSLTDIRGDYPGDVYGEWTGEGVTFMDPDGIKFSGDEFYQFSPTGLDGTYTLTYTIGDEPCIFTYAQDIRVTCQDLQIELSDITVCPANWVEERVVIVNLDDKDLVVTTTGLTALGVDGAHYGGGPLTNPVIDLVDAPAIKGRVVIPGFYAPAVRYKDYEICVTTYQTTPFGCVDVFCYTITVQDTIAPDFQNCPKDPIIVDAPFGWCSSFVNFEYPWAYDNCMGLYSRIEQVDITGLKSGSLFPVGLTILSYTATDTVGNQSYCEIKIVVNDFHTPPNVDCPMVAVERPNDPEKCGAVVNNIAPTKVEDNCRDNVAVLYEIKDATGKLIGCGFEDASGDFFPVGTNTVKYKVQDQPLILITEVVQDGVVSGMEITNFGPAAVDITCAKFVLKNAAGMVLETFTLPSNNNISNKFDRPIYPPYVTSQSPPFVPSIPLVWNYRNPDNILQVGETFTHIFNGDQDGDGDVDVVNVYNRCDERRYCFAFLDRVIDEAWINDQVDGAVILRKNVCDQNLQSDFIPATPCDPGNFGMLNPGLPTMTPNGTTTALQNVDPGMDMCTFTVKVNDVEAPTCIWHDTIPKLITMVPLGTPLNILANQCLTATINMPPGIVDDVNIYNLKITTLNAGAITAYLRGPSGTRIKLFDRVCGTDYDFCGVPPGISGSPNVNINLDETIKWIPAPSVLNAVCNPAMGAGGIYRPEESFKAFYGEAGGGIWTLEIFGEEGVTGILTDWDLQILYRIPFSQPDVVIENAPGRCDEEFSWIHPILEDNCCVGKVDITYTFDNIITNVHTVENGVIKNENGSVNVQGCLNTRIFPVGITEIKYTLEDQYGNLNTCGFKVTVLDTEEPVFLAPFCPDRVIVLAPTECYGVLTAPPSAADNCQMEGVTFCFADGSAADINNLPIGVYNLTAKAEDIYGNIQTCVFQVSVIEFIPTSSVLACNNHINLSLDGDCSAVLTADMILEGNLYRCFENYCIEVRTTSGVIHSNLFTANDEGKTFIVSVIDCNGPNPTNSCWGTVTIEEKLLPVFKCPGDLTVACNIDVEARNPSTGKLLTGEATLESCELGANINWQDVWVNYDQCNNPRALVRRTWTIFDTEGNKVECVQDITIKPLNLNDIVFPSDYDFARAFDCYEVSKDPQLTNPSNTGFPTLNGVQVNKSGSLCMVSLNHSDEIYEICNGSYEILRTWKVRNMCLPVSPTNPRTHVQVIKILDTQGPVIKECPSDVTLSVNPWSCRASGILHGPLRVEELCGNGYTFKANIYGGGRIQAVKNTDGTLSATYSDLYTGDYLVVYTLKDDCGNKSTCSFNISVFDKVAPIPIVKRDIVIGLTSGHDANGIQDAQAKLFAESVDNGSHDNCSPVRLEIRRPRGSACGNLGVGGHNNNGTFSNFPIPFADNNVSDNDGGNYVKFCCVDLDIPDADYNGDGLKDTGFHEVILRVWDDGNKNGVIGDEGDNYNETWAIVEVECKVPPVITCPPNTTIYCDWAIHTNFGDFKPLPDSIRYLFNKTGLPEAYGACGDLPISWKDEKLEWTQCETGIIRRTFRTSQTKKGVTLTRDCIQMIEVKDSPFDQPWVFDPNTLTGTFSSTSCTTPDSAAIKAAAPKWTAGPCDVIGVSTKIWEFDFEDGACKKWKVEYKYVNWCDNKEAGPFYKYWYYFDEKPPVIECRDTMYAQGADCKLPNLSLSKVATDENGCNAAGWLKWEIFVDLWADGYDDYLFSSFVPNAVPYTTTGLVQVNPVTQRTVIVRYTPATKSGEARTIVIPEVIEGKMSNHKIAWKVSDGCHNFSTCHESFMVVDKKAPTSYCVNLSTALMAVPAGTTGKPMVELWARDFDKGSYDGDLNWPCTPQEDLLFTFENWKPSQGSLASPLTINGLTYPTGTLHIDVEHYFDSLGTYYVIDAANRVKYLEGTYQRWLPSAKSSAKVWNSDALGGQPYVDVPVKMTVWDKKLNHDYCWVTLKLICNGSGCPEGNGFTISGNLSTDQNQRVKNADILLQSDIYTELFKSTVSDSEGQFEFKKVLGGLNYNLSARKSGNYLEGVTTLDLVMIQQHILGLSPFNSPYKTIAADANNDLKVTASDLTELRKLILGIIPVLSKNASWRFPIVGQNLNIQYPFPFEEKLSVNELSTDLAAQNFKAVKIGDISGNASTDITNPYTETRTEGALKIFIDEVAIRKGDILAIPLTSDNFMDVYGFQFTLNLKGGSFVGLQNGILDINENNIGVLNNDMVTFSYSSVSGVNADKDDILFTIFVKAENVTDITELIAISSDITKAEYYKGSELKIGNVGLHLKSVPVTAIELFQNEPNPFRGQTTVTFEMPHSAKATLSVHDVTGKIVAIRNIDAHKGMNSEIFTKEQLGASGVLYYTLVSGEFTATKKMIIVE